VSFLRFQIRHPTGQVEHLNVEGERVLIGSGAHCEIRLPIDQSAVESVLVQRSAGGVFAQALSFEPPPTINNTPFSQAPLQPESALGIGPVQIYVTLSDTAQGEAVIAKKKQATSPVTLVLAAVCALGAAYYFLLMDEEKGPAPQPTQVPELWEPPVRRAPPSKPLRRRASPRPSPTRDASDARSTSRTAWPPSLSTRSRPPASARAAIRPHRRRP
jgi:hypothetical protein